jgi:peroxiredoxin Q/BCP
VDSREVGHATSVPPNDDGSGLTVGDAAGVAGALVVGAAVVTVGAGVVGAAPGDDDVHAVASATASSAGRFTRAPYPLASLRRVTERLAPGDPAPDFSLPDVDGNVVSLSSLRGRKVVVYFYPAALTPGCTKQACGFRDSLADFAGAGYEVLGISPDKPEKLAKFREVEGLTFPLLSDPSREVLTAYGAYGRKQLYGKEVTGVIRSTFVVGEDGRIERAMYGVKATGHVEKLRRELGV